MFLSANENITVGSTLRALSMAVNVRSFGAVGDGVVDDTAAIQEAINSLPVRGGVVYLPAGSYKISSSITVRSRLRITGDGDATTMIEQSNTSADGLVGVDIDRLVVDRVKVGGPASGTGVGIRLTRNVNGATTYITITDALIANWGSDGISMSNPIVSRFERVISQANGGHGFNLYGNPTGSAGTSCALVACYGNGNQFTGFRLYNMAYSSLVGCAADSNGLGYLIENCQGVSLSGCGAEVTQNLSSTYNGTSLKISGGFSVDVRAFWTYLNNAVGIYVTGNAKTVTLAACTEMDPGPSATQFVKVDSGCSVTMIGNKNFTPNFLTFGTTQVLDDDGKLNLRGSLSSASTGYFEGNVTSGSGNFVLAAAGKGLFVKEGANAKMGVGTLVAGTATITSTSVTANSRIFLTHQTPGAAPGALRVDSRVAGANFTVKSTSATDTGTFAYFIVEPS